MNGWLLSQGPANHFDPERSLSSQDIFKTNRATALAEWRSLCSGERDVV